MAWQPVFSAWLTSAEIAVPLEYELVSPSRGNPQRMQHSNHVILFGSGHLVFQVGRKLRADGLSVVHIELRRLMSPKPVVVVLVIEKDQENRVLEAVRSQGAKIFVGDASIPKVFERRRR